jgi:hypothetical protein
VARFVRLSLREPGAVSAQEFDASELVAPAHEHAWELRSVDFTDGVAVEELVCHDCGEVWFR